MHAGADVQEALLPAPQKFPRIFYGSQCQYCHAYTFPDEAPGFCCNSGYVHLELPSDPPILLQNLLNGLSMANRIEGVLKTGPLYIDLHKAYMDDIRSYNNAFSMASLGLEGREIKPGQSFAAKGGQATIKGFMPVLKFQGAFYHALPPLKPEDGQPRKFAQIYIHDGNEDYEVKQRQSHFKKKLDERIMLDLQKMMHEVNPYVKDFIAISKLPEEQMQNITFIMRRDRKPDIQHARKYNIPTCNEVALVALNEVNDHADVRIHRKGGVPQHITNLNPSYDPLHYVLLFPYGSPG